MDTAVLDKPVAAPREGTGRFESETVRTLRRRARVFQRHHAFEPEVPEGLEVRRALTVEDLEQAYRLVHECFAAAGYIEPHPTGLRVRAFSVLPDTALYIAVADGKVVGTLSMIPDGPLGLPMEQAFETEIERLRYSGRRLVEVSDLAIDENYRNLRVLTELTRCAMAHALFIGAEDAVVAVSPSHSGFFEGILQFESLGHARSYSTEKVDIVEGKRLRLLCIQEKYRGIDKVLGSDGFLEEFFFLSNPYCARMEEWLEQGWQEAKDVNRFVDFFVKRAALLARCTDEELGVLERYYPAVAAWHAMARNEAAPAWQRGQRLTQVLRRAVAAPAVSPSG